MGIRHIGVENAKIISENVKSIKDLINIIKSKKLSKFSNINGIGDTQINSLINFFSKESNLKIFIELESILKIKTIDLNKNGVLKNKTFMFTGKLNGISRAEAKSLIEKNSGTTLTSVSKNLNYLVAGEKPTKRKVEEAKRLNIKIISQDQLKNLLN